MNFLIGFAVCFGFLAYCLAVAWSMVQLVSAGHPWGAAFLTAGAVATLFGIFFSLDQD